MKIKILNQTIMDKVKNKERFCENLFNQLVEIYKNETELNEQNKMLLKIREKKEKLIEKNKNLDLLLEKSKKIFEDFTEKNNEIDELKKITIRKLINKLERNH
jgi:hypothetical protein